MVDTSWVARKFADDKKQYDDSSQRMRAEEHRRTHWLAAAREYYSGLRADLRAVVEAFNKHIPDRVSVKRVSIHEESIEVASYKYAHVAATVTLNVDLERIDCVYRSTVADPIRVTYKLIELPDDGMALQVSRDEYVTIGDEARTIIEPFFEEARRYINAS